MNVTSKKLAVTLSYVNTALSYLVMLLLTPLIIKIIGKSEFGLYTLVNSIIGYLALLSLGFGSAYVRFYFRVKRESEGRNIEKLNGTYFLTYAVMTFMVVAGGIILIIFSKQVFGPKLTPEEHDTAKILLAILTFNLAGTFIFSIFWSYLRAIQHFVIIEFALLIKTLLSPIFTISLLLLGFGSIGFVASTAVVTLLIEIFITIYAFKKGEIKFNFSTYDKSLFKEILLYSIFIFGFEFLNQVNNGVDNIVLGWTAGTEIVSIYAIGITITGIMLSLPNGINNVITPEINRISSSEEEKLKTISDMQVRFGRMIFMIIAFILSGFILFGNPFLNLWVGAGFEDAYWIVIIMGVSKIFGYSLTVSSIYIKAENIHKTRLISFAIAILLNIAITIPLAIYIGPIGAAIGTGVTYFMYTIFMHFYYVHIIKIQLYRFWKEVVYILIIYLLLLAPFFILTLFVDLSKLWILLVVGIGYVLAFVIVNIIFVLNDYEKNLFFSIFKRKKISSNQSPLL